VIDAPVLVALANAGRPCRPPGTRRPVTEDPFEDATSATRMLKTFLGRSVDAGEVDDLRRLAREAGRIAAGLVDGVSPSARAFKSDRGRLCWTYPASADTRGRARGRRRLGRRAGRGGPGPARHRRARRH